MSEQEWDLQRKEARVTALTQGRLGRTKAHFLCAGVTAGVGRRGSKPASWRRELEALQVGAGGRC